MSGKYACPFCLLDTTDIDNRILRVQSKRLAPCSAPLTQPICTLLVILIDIGYLPVRG